MIGRIKALENKMTMLMVYISALVLGFMIVAVIVLAYEIFNCDDAQHESWGMANTTTGTQIPVTLRQAAPSRQVPSCDRDRYIGEKIAH